MATPGLYQRTMQKKGMEWQQGEAKQGKKKEYLLRLVGGNSMDWVPPGLSEKRLGILERSLDMIPGTPLIGSVVDPGKPSPCQLPSGPEQPIFHPVCRRADRPGTL